MAFSCTQNANLKNNSCCILSNGACKGLKIFSIKIKNMSIIQRHWQNFVIYFFFFIISFPYELSRSARFLSTKPSTPCGNCVHSHLYVIKLKKYERLGLNSFHSIAYRTCTLKKFVFTFCPIFREIMATHD